MNLKYLLSFLAFFSIVSGSAQNLTLYGKIQYYDLPKNGRLYYSLKGEHFSSRQGIAYTATGEYSFTIKLAEIRQKMITTIAFGIDSTSDPSSEYACVHRVRVDGILQYPRFQNSKSIRINSDLLINYHCEESVAFKASNDGNGDLVGSYQMQYKDTIWNIHLNDMLYSSSANLMPANAEHMNLLTGSWQFDKAQQSLSIHLYTQWNQALGIALNRPRSFIFHVEEVNGQLRFISDKYTLTRL